MIPGLEAPEPLTLDTARKTISYQRMLGLIPFIGRCNDKGLAAKTGALIAQLHLTETTSSTEDERSAAAWLRSIGTSDRDIETIRSHVSPGFLHKDCWHGNLFWNHRGGLVMLDAVPAHDSFKSAPTNAYGLMDVAMLHMSLHLCHGLCNTLTRSPHKKYGPAADAIVRSYVEELQSRKLYGCILRASKNMAERYAAAYRQRLNPALALAKSRLASIIIQQTYPENIDEL